MHVTQAVVDGIAQGAIIALAAMGITLIFRISHFANVAHGDLMTVGAYVGLGGMTWFSLPILPAAVLGVIATSLVGVLLYKFVFKPLRDNVIALFITSIGIALMLRAVVQLVWGSGVVAYSGLSNRTLHMLNLRISVSDALVVGFCAAAGIAFFTLLHRTRIGREIRATANDEALARVTGIDVGRVTRFVWVIATALAGVAGVLLAVNTSLSPDLGWNLLLPAFAAAILGGLGNTSGAAIGGLVVGIAMQLAVLVAPAGYKPGVAFAIMILVLVIRPTGVIPTRVRV